jgi:hypothetical protein
LLGQIDEKWPGYVRPDTQDRGKGARQVNQYGVRPGALEAAADTARYAAAITGPAAYSTDQSEQAASEIARL